MTKVLSQTGLTELIQLSKNEFLPKSGAVEATTVQLATVATSGSYNDLSNKPTIPTVNNATLTIQKNGSNVATFTANASSNVTANISVPNTVSSVSSSSTNADAVGAKLFYDTVGDIEAALHTINSGGVQTATLTVRVYDNLSGFYSFTINGETYTDFSTSGNGWKIKDINIPINTDLPWTASAESSFKVTPASGTLNISSDYILELEVDLDLDI